jgi:hypothetical protein
MILTPLAFTCPKCGSADVVYSCTPSCCFNHVCGQCYATFEPKTERVGEYAGEIGPLPEADSAGSTAPCARCGEYKLFVIMDETVPAERLLCISCRALLTIELESE